MPKASRLVTGAIAMSTMVMPVAVSAHAVPHPTAIHLPFLKAKGIDLKNLTVGTVASINGNVITLNGMNKTSYTVDVSAATFSKGPRSAAIMSLSDIKVGDILAVSGTVTGMSVAATEVNDLGVPAGAMTHESMISGTVTALTGSSITVTGKDNVSYTILAGNATFPSGFFGSTLTLSSIQVGDKLMAMGTLTGTSLTATSIRDASFLGRTIFNGIVSAISGNSITLQARNNATYTVDAGAAKITKGPGKATTGTVSDIATGDHLMVAGTLSGTAISATAIKDMGNKPIFSGHAGFRGSLHGGFRGHGGSKR